MDSRTRVITALAHEEPDRVPIDLGGMRSTGIMAMAYNQLKKYWGMRDGHTKLCDIGQQLARVEPQVLERIRADVIPVSVDIAMNKKWKPWQLPDGSACEVPEDFNPEKLDDGSFVLRDETGRIVAKMPPGGYYFDGTYHALADASSISDLRTFTFYRPIPAEVLDALEADAKTAYETTQYAIMLGGAGGIYEAAQGLRGWDQFLMDLAADPKFAAYLLDKLVEANIQRLAQILPRVKPYVQVVQGGDDLGMQNGPQISPETYRTLIKPRHKVLYQFIKKNSNASLFLHTCGSIYRLIPDLIDAGVDIFNPVQVAARDMDSAKLKKEFGNDAVFWGGGCDTQRVLPFGTPQEVRDEVKRRIHDLAPGGGFVFTQVHNIQAGVPPENIEAMFDAAWEFGKY